MVTTSYKSLLDVLEHFWIKFCMTTICGYYMSYEVYLVYGERLLNTLDVILCGL